MERIVIGITIVLLSLVGVVEAVAQTGNEEQSSPAVQQIMQEIRSQQDLGTNESINSDRVPSALMIKLGDAVMDLLVPNEQQHRFMDEMMGGEGSASLDAMHEWFAYRYLTGGYGRYGNGYGMMGGGMTGNPGVSYQTNPYQSPAEIAAQRYAQGAMTSRQYARVRTDLHQPAGATKQ